MKRRNFGMEEMPGDVERKHEAQDGREGMPHDRMYMNVNGLI